MRIAARAILAALLLTAHVGATSVVPVSFTDLVTRADVIFVGEVTDVRPFMLESSAGTVIMTRVSFSVADPLFGTTSLVEVFDFLGGQIGDVGMRVAEMPEFAIGDRTVVFARREQSINPIVGFSQGLLRVTRDGAGIDRVQTLDRRPLARVESIGKMLKRQALRREQKQAGKFGWLDTKGAHKQPDKRHEVKQCQPDDKNVDEHPLSTLSKGIIFKTSARFVR